MKKVYIESNGCAVLRHETYKIAKCFELNGYVQTDAVEVADAIIYTGCAVIESNERWALDSIERILKEKQDNSIFVVTGCLPTIAGEYFDNIDDKMIVLKNDQMTKLNEIFSFDIYLQDVTYNCEPTRHHSFGDPEIKISKDESDDEKLANKIDSIFGRKDVYNQFVYSTRGRHLWREDDLFEIRVAYGCAGECSYCATKLAIGKFRSVKESVILEQVKLAKEKGYSRIMLMGDEIGFWNENGRNIVDLLTEINTLAPEIKIGIRYISPDIITKYYQKLEQFFANGSIYYFCAALQSGSPRILRLMNRNPDINPFIRCMENMDNKNYPVMRHSQIIVGFPSETSYDVMLTLKCLYKASFDHVTVTRYCPRRGTKAYDYEMLDENIVNEYMEILNCWLNDNRHKKLYKKIRNEVLSSDGKL